jgi:hypothetical protein
MSIGKIGPISVVTTPVTTNPPWRTTDAAEDIGSEADRVWIEFMLKASAGMLACGEFTGNEERRAGCKIIVILLRMR